MLDLAGRMILEGSLATKDDLNRLRDGFMEFKLEVIERLATHRVEFLHEIGALRSEMNGQFAELRTETNSKFADMNGQFVELRGEVNEKLSAAAIDSRDRSSSSLKWMVGVVIGGIGVNAAVVGIGLAVVGLAAG